MKSLLPIILTFCWLQVNSQDFTNVTPMNMEPLNRGDFAVGDYNNDQKLDIINSGAIQALGLTKGATNIYKSNGAFSFDLLQDQVLDSVFQSANIWGDFNNDGLLDIVISGWLNGPLSTSMYFNDGNGQFVQNQQMDFEDLGYGDLAMGDLDNDGDLDLVNVGFASTGARKSIIYINNSDSTFNILDNVLIGLDVGSVALADYDLDGDLDILISGSTGSIINEIDEAFTLLYQNTDGQFEVTNEFEPIKNGKANWIDYNVDGSPDIILSGYNGTEVVSKLYLNDGNEEASFSESDLIFDALAPAAIAVGDLNSDGYPDMIHSSSGSVVNVYINDQNNGFNKLAGHNLNGSFEGNIELADLDNDFDLDVMLSGTTTSSIYRNNISAVNSKPNAPTNLQVTDDNMNSLTFTWDTATDAETPSAALSYNYFLVFDGDTLVFPNSHTNGSRKIQNLGNALSGMAIINHRSPGSYTLGVQTIDQTLNASGFATLEFQINHPPVVENAQPIDINEDEPLDFQLSSITVSDPDNDFPDDFTFSIANGENYEVQGGTITPLQDFFGELELAIRVFDGADSSNVFLFNIQVNPVNDPPVVNDILSEIFIFPGRSRIFSIDDFDISDVDNSKNELTISLLEGDNYEINNLELITNESFDGALTVEMIAYDGVDSSSVFMFIATVSSVLSIGMEDDVFTVFPNPVDHFLELNFTNDYLIRKIEIISLSGKVVVAPIITRSSTIDLSNFTPGVYQLNVEVMNGDVFTEKIIIK